MDTICSCTRVNNLHYRSPRNTIIYNLVREGDSEYGIECYIKGQTKTDYCLCRDISHDRATAEKIFKLLSRKKVYPVHVKVILEDLYTY